MIRPGNTAGQQLRTLYFVISCLLLVSTSQAQESPDTRLYWAARFGDASVVLHVSVPQGVVIEQAILTTSSSDVGLTIQPDPLPVIQWLVLDASQNMVNIGPQVQNSLENALSDFTNAATGLIIYHDAGTVYEPTHSQPDIARNLDAYDPQDRPVACVYDALAELAASPYLSDMAARGLLVSAGISDQTECQHTTLTSPGMPIDVLLLLNSDDAALREIAESSGGEFLRAQLPQLQARFDDIRTRWSQPVFRLDSAAGAVDDDRGEVKLSLSDDSEVVFEVAFAVFADLLSDGSPLPTPTLTSTVTLTPSATASATITPSRTSSPTSTGIVPSVTFTNTPTIQPTQPIVPATNLQTSRVQATTQPTATRTISPAATLVPPSPIPVVPPKVVDNNVLIIGGGIAAGAVVLLVVVLLLRPSGLGKPEATVGGSDSTRILPTAHAESDDFYEIAPRPSGTVIVQEGEELDFAEIDTERESTEMISLEDVLAAIRPPVVGSLLNETAGQSYEIKRPTTLLGRDPICDIIIQRDRQISRQHVRFNVAENDRATIAILTHNPVLINGIKVEGTVQLKTGDVLQLSTKTRVVFQYIEVK